MENITVEQTEPATGQAAFSQDRVTLDARIWDKGAEFSVGSDKPLHLELRVRYVHVGGEGNGYSIGYKIITTFGALFLVKAR